MKRTVSLGLALLLIAFCAGCGSAETPAAAAPTREPEPTGSGLPPQSAAEDGPQTQDQETEDANMEKSLRLFISGTEVAVDWEENESVGALIELASAGPLSVQMSMYGGFEQVGALGTSLPRNDVQTTTQSGDIVLYAGDQIVVFYGSNSWAYTRLGRVSELSAEDMTKLLANGDVVIELSLEQEEK